MYCVTVLVVSEDLLYCCTCAFSCQDVLEYRIKHRPLRVKTLDGTIKTVLVCGYGDLAVPCTFYISVDL